MRAPALEDHDVRMIVQVLQRHAEVSAASVFGSRAKGNHTAGSDVDLAVWGDVDELGAEAIAAELDELPLPYRFEVRSFSRIRLEPLREHIERVGIPIYSAPDASGR